MKNLQTRILIFVSTICLTGCISVSNKIGFNISSSRDFSEISIFKSKIGFYTNIHGGNSDSYSFVVPRNLDLIKASQITSAWFKYKKMPLDFSDTSEILISSGAKSCTLTLKLFDIEGKPSILNGTYVEFEYAESNFKKCER